MNLEFGSVWFSGAEDYLAHFLWKKFFKILKLVIFPIKGNHKEQNENWWECREVSVGIILHKRVLESRWMWSVIKIPKSLDGEAKCR